MNAREGARDVLAPSTTMSETTRIFFAIAIPEPLGQDLVRLQDASRPSFRDAGGVDAAFPFDPCLSG